MDSVIYLRSGDFKRLAVMDHKKLVKAVERLRSKVAQATEWEFLPKDIGSAAKIHVVDSDNVPTLTVQFEEVGTYFWDRRGSTSIYIFDLCVPNEKEVDALLCNVADGRLCCNKCKKWLPAHKLKQAGFAGRVCAKCYDPVRDKMPSTVGD